MKECARQYPPNWKEFSRKIRFERAAGRCECAGECGLHRTTGGPRRCVERDGEPAKWAKGTIVLTVAHLCRPKDHGGKKCAEPSHVKAMCQRCHLLTDQEVHMTHAAMTRVRKKRQLEIFPLEEP